MTSFSRIPRANSWWWALFPILCGLGLVTFLFTLAVNQAAWEKHSHWLGNSAWPVFSDLAVTQQHIRDAAHGLDPLSDSTSSFAYPRAVLELRHFRFHDVPTAWLGAVQASLWMAAVIFILRPRNLVRAVLCTAIFFTPPVVLGLERGNLDMLLFVLCTAIAVGWARSQTLNGVFLPVIATSIAALLKLYPAFALIGGAVVETGRRRLVWLGAGAGVGAYWIFNFAEIKLVLSKFPVGGGYSSWGCFIGLKSLFYSWGVDKHLSWAWGLSLAIYALGFIGLAALGRAYADKFVSFKTSRREWAYYWIGSAICCGSFLASNYSYRWVFALLTLPVLLPIAGGSRFLAGVWARTALAALALSLVAPSNGGPAAFYTEQIASWIYVLLLVFGGFALAGQHSAPGRRVTRRRPAERSVEESTPVGDFVAITIGAPDEPPTISTCRSLLGR